MASHFPTNPIYRLARTRQKASKEPDQDKVLDLVRQLDERLEEEEKQKRQPTGPTPQSPKTQ